MVQIFYRHIHSEKLRTLTAAKVGSWVNAVAPSEHELQDLAETYGLDHGLLLDGVDLHESPRIENEGGATYIFTRFCYSDAGRIHTAPILIVYAKQHLITVLPKPFAGLDRLTAGRLPLVTMTTNKRAGFTLIEITLVMAISAALVLIAIRGQQHLRQQASFDAAISKILQEFSYARNYALSNVNSVGSGNYLGAVIAGEAIEFEGSAGSTLELETLYAHPDSNGYVDMSKLGTWPYGVPNPSPVCPPAQHPVSVGECYESFVGLPDKIALATYSDDSFYFVNTGGNLTICNHPNALTSMTLPQICAATPPPPFIVALNDPYGFQATIVVDESGYAHRQ